MTQKTLSESMVAALFQAPERDARGTPACQAGLAASPVTPALTITIQREPWSEGSAVADAVGQALGWPVYDKELLPIVGRKMGTHPRMLELIDEKAMSWLGQCVLNMTSACNLDQDSYLVHLEGAIRNLGHWGRCVIVGHGAGFLLPPTTTLRVQIVSAPRDRVAAIQKSTGLVEREATRLAEKMLREQQTFFKKFFDKDIADPHLYDLVLNVSRMSVEKCAGTILEALQSREGWLGLDQGGEPKSWQEVEDLRRQRECDS